MQISSLGGGWNLGGIYRQNRVGFQEDLIKYGHYGELVRLTDKISQLMRIEMYIMMGAMAAVGGTPVLLWTIGTNVGEFIAKNQSKFPAWSAAVGISLATRKVLKAYAPTLYDKLVNALLLGAWKGLKIVTLAFGTDIASNIPEAMISDEEKVAKAAGALVGRLGKTGWTGKAGVAKVVLVIVTEVATHALMSFPIAANMKATEIVDKLKAAGVSITQAEGEQIVFEVTKNAKILLPEILKLKKAIEDC